MEFLPLDLKNKIMGYLPVLNKKLKKMLSEIRKIYMISDVIRNCIVKTKHLGSYEDFLYYDITHWMNNNVGRLIRIEEKYKQIASIAFKKSTGDIDTYLKIFYHESRHNHLHLCRLYLQSMSENQLKSLSYYCDVYGSQGRSLS
jgi:hypothetical protein